MTRFAPLAAALVLTTLACTETTPDELELELEAEALPSELALPDYEVVPEIVLASDDTVPHLELREGEYLSEDHECPLDIEASGFPAISADGHTLVLQRGGTRGNADFTEHHVVVFAGNDEQDELVLENDYLDAEGCAGLRRGAQAKIDALNARFAAKQWRTLERLPDTLDLHWHAGWLSVRIPGQAVIERQARPDLRNPIDEGICDTAPTFSGLWFDRATRRAIATFTYEGASCMCGNDETQAAVVIGQATIDAADELEPEGC